MRHKSFFLYFFIWSNVTFATTLDSLQQLLFQTTSVAEKAMLFNAITWEAYNQDHDSTIQYGEQAIAFAQQHQLKQPLLVAYLQFADMLRWEKNFKAAESYLTKGKALLQNNSFEQEQVLYYLIKGKLAYSQYKDDEAFKSLEKGYSLHKKHHTKYCFDFCSKLAAICKNKGQYTEAEVFFKEGLACNNSPIDKVKLKNNLANLYAQQEAYKKALDIYTQNAALAKQLPNALEESRAYLNIGNIHLIEDRWQLAVEFYLKSATIKENIKDEQGLVELHQNIAIVYQNQNRNDKSLEYYQKCEDYYNKTQDTVSLIEIWNNTAGIYIAQEKLAQAIALLNKVLVAVKSHPAPSITLKAQMNLGAIHMETGEYLKALEAFNQSAQEAQQQEDRLSLANIHNFLGAVYFYLKDYKQSIDHYYISLLTSQELGIVEEQKPALFGLYESNEYLGNTKEALAWHKKYVAIKDSLYNTATTNRIAELQEQYDTKQKEQAIQQLNIENKNIALESELKTKRLNQFLLIIIFGAVVMCFLGLLWWYRNKEQKERMRHTQVLHEKQVNQLLNQQEIEMLDAVVEAQQKERKGVAKEIHDTLGSYLATLKYQHEAGKELASNPANQEQYQLMEQLIGQTAKEVRSIAHQMATGEKFDFDLQAAIDQLVHRIRNTQQFDLQFNYFGEAYALPRDLELTLYRVTQELLSNILKHAQASEAMVQINQNESELTLMVEDNGRGFEVQPSNTKKGLGLQSIRERMAPFNGQVNIDSHPQHGTTVIITIPTA